MPSDFDSRLRAMAEVIVRVGVNLQPGQPLLITEPYELQGVHPEAASLVESVRAAAPDSAIEVIEAAPARLRAQAEANDMPGYDALVSSHTRRMQQHLARRGAFLFLLGSQPQLMSGLPAERLSRFDRIKWPHLGPVIQRLIRGASQWTIAPAPSTAWANAAFIDLPSAERLPALWQTVFQAMRVADSNAEGSLPPDSVISGRSSVAKAMADKKASPTTDSCITAWQLHLAALARHRDELNTARHRSIRYIGPGTNLRLDLPRSHTWCTAQRTSKAGVPFVANLPTEEVFTAPHKNSACGKVRVARSVTHGGSVIVGIELEFLRGRVVAARAATGQDLLQQMLATDAGACRIGEVALVGSVGGSLSPGYSGHKAPSNWQTSRRLFHHALLDENAANHIALGDAYRFCSRALLPLALNSSQVHLDLPLNSTVEFS